MEDNDRPYPENTSLQQPTVIGPSPQQQPVSASTPSDQTPQIPLSYTSLQPPKQSKPFKKVILVSAISILILALGVGFYIYSHLASPKTTASTENVTPDLNSSAQQSPVDPALVKQADDTKISFIDALDDQIVIFYNQHGRHEYNEYFYPAKNSFYQTEWVKNNMKDVNLVDYEKYKNDFKYTVTPDGCHNGYKEMFCSNYSLSIDLEKDGLGGVDKDGNTADYVKKSAN